MNITQIKQVLALNFPKTIDDSSSIKINEDDYSVSFKLSDVVNYKQTEINGDLISVYDTSPMPVMPPMLIRSYRTDSEGNITKVYRNGTTTPLFKYTYDCFGQVTCIEDYDSDGIRTSKIINNVTTTCTLQGTKITSKKTGNDLTVYHYDENDFPVAFTHNGTKYYYLKNLQGDITQTGYPH